MLATIEKSKDQFIVVLPKAYCENNKVKAGDVIELPESPPPFVEQRLLGFLERAALMGDCGIDPEEVDWGPDVGEEIIRD